MTQLFPDFEEFLLELHAARVEFLVVGGLAVAHHGHARATKDLDVLVRPSDENAARVMRALQSFGAPVGSLGITESDFRTAGTIVQLGLPPVRIDLLTRIDGLDFDQATLDADSFEVSGTEVPVIGLQALLANKRASGRPQDLADVAALESLER